MKEVLGCFRAATTPEHVETAPHHRPADWILAKGWGPDGAEFEVAGNLRDRMAFGNKE